MSRKQVLLTPASAGERADQHTHITDDSTQSQPNILHMLPEAHVMMLEMAEQHTHIIEYNIQSQANIVIAMGQPIISHQAWSF